MRAVIQRVRKASVSIKGKTRAGVRQGLLILLGIEKNDLPAHADWLCAKIVNLRIFSDAEGKMNLSVADVSGGLLVVSQFTLHASTRKGNRPSFARAAKPADAAALYAYFVEQLKNLSHLDVQTGEFGAMMDVSLINDGPVTIIIDSELRE